MKSPHERAAEEVYRRLRKNANIAKRRLLDRCEKCEHPELCSQCEAKNEYRLHNRDFEYLKAVRRSMRMKGQ